jgi:hypothetical protein
MDRFLQIFRFEAIENCQAFTKEMPIRIMHV